MLAGTLGDRMLVLFGYPHTSDTDARQAGMTAQELLTLSRSRAAAIEQVHGLHLGIRMGLHTGMAVVVGGEAPSGHAVNVAMRLEAIADAGTLLASESSHRLLSRHARFEKAGSLRLPGQPTGMQTYRLELEQPAELLQGPVSDAALQCIGREPELQRLHDAWARAREAGAMRCGFAASRASANPAWPTCCSSTPGHRARTPWCCNASPSTATPR